MTYSIIQKSQLEGAQRIDAEYFAPIFIEMEKQLKSTTLYKPWGKLEGDFITGPFGSEFNVENYSQQKDYRYIRGKDVKKIFLGDDDNVYISQADFERLKKYSLQEGDILLSVVGTLGNAAVVSKSNLPAIFSCKSTAFRSTNIDPYYLLAYLNSKYGQNLLLRNARGQVQAGLNIHDLKSLLIFLPLLREQKIIASIIKEAKNQLINSEKHYEEAENLLLEELGLVDFAKDELAYVVDYKDVVEVERADADYFQPKYESLVSKLYAQGAKPFLEIVRAVSARFDPTKEQAKTFHYIELSGIDSSIGIIENVIGIKGAEAPSRAKRKVKEGDVLVSSVAGSLGKVALVNTEQDGYLASTGFFQFRSEKILPEVLLVAAKSPVLQLQLERQTSGTILSAVPQRSLESLVIPELPIPTQQKIASLVQKSHQARKKSKQLLEEAKRKVEEIIKKQQV